MFRSRRLIFFQWVLSFLFLRLISRCAAPRPNVGSVECACLPKCEIYRLIWVNHREGYNYWIECAVRECRNIYYRIDRCSNHCQRLKSCSRINVVNRNWTCSACYAKGNNSIGRRRIQSSVSVFAKSLVDSLMGNCKELINLLFNLSENDISSKPYKLSKTHKFSQRNLNANDRKPIYKHYRKK